MGEDWLELCPLSPFIVFTCNTCLGSLVCLSRGCSSIQVLGLPRDEDDGRREEGAEGFCLFTDFVGSSLSLCVRSSLGISGVLVVVLIILETPATSGLGEQEEQHHKDHNYDRQHDTNYHTHSLRQQRITVI